MITVNELVKIELLKKYYDSIIDNNKLNKFKFNISQKPKHRDIALMDICSKYLFRKMVSLKNNIDVDGEDLICESALLKMKEQGEYISKVEVKKYESMLDEYKRSKIVDRSLLEVIFNISQLETFFMIRGFKKEDYQDAHEQDLLYMRDNYKKIIKNNITWGKVRLNPMLGYEVIDGLVLRADACLTNADEIYDIQSIGKKKIEREIIYKLLTYSILIYGNEKTKVNNISVINSRSNNIYEIKITNLFKNKTSDQFYTETLEFIKELLEELVKFANIN